MKAALTYLGDTFLLGEVAKEPDISTVPSSPSPSAVGSRKTEVGDPLSDPESELPVLESVSPIKVTPDEAVSVTTVTPPFAVWMVPLKPWAAMPRPAAAAPSA